MVVMERTDQVGVVEVSAGPYGGSGQLNGGAHKALFCLFPEPIHEDWLGADPAPDGDGFDVKDRLKVEDEVAQARAEGVQCLERGRIASLDAIEEDSSIDGADWHARGVGVAGGQSTNAVEGVELWAGRIGQVYFGEARVA